MFCRIERFQIVTTPLISILKCFESNPEDSAFFVNPLTGQEHLNCLVWFGELNCSFGENIEVMDCKLRPEVNIYEILLIICYSWKCPNLPDSFLILPSFFPALFSSSSNPDLFPFLFLPGQAMYLSMELPAAILTLCHCHCDDFC